MAPMLAVDPVVSPAASPGDASRARLIRQRPGASPALQTRRARSANLDSLAIGAPLTAAFVGMLLAEAGAAANGGQEAIAQAGAATGSGPQPGELEPGSISHGGLPMPAAGEGVAAGGGSQQAALDPVSVDTAAAAAALPQVEAGGGGRADGAASEVSAGVAGKAGTAGALSGNVTLFSPDDGATDGAAPPGEDGGTGGAGPIGDHVTGSNGDDVIHGTPGDDHIAGGAGDDVIFGHEGDDTLLGETGRASCRERV